MGGPVETSVNVSTEVSMPFMEVSTEVSTPSMGASTIYLKCGRQFLLSPSPRVSTKYQHSWQTFAEQLAHPGTHWLGYS